MTSYQTYAASSFNKLPMLAMLETAGSILIGICKPPIAKLSDVVGRGETYILMVLLYILSYIICASAASFSAYVGGCVLYAIAQSGTGMLNSVLVSDFSSVRWRGLSWNLMYLPFFITACVSAFIVNSVVHRIGWRWGIGMFGMLMPISASLLIIMLLLFERRARKTGLILTEGCPSLCEFCSRIDLGGVGLLSGGFAMLLIPITMAATTSHQWKTPWIDALIATGALALALFYPYEKYCARHPVVPVEYFQNPPIVIGVLMGCIDTISFSATHTYLYPWSMVAHNLSPRDAQFLVYTNGIMQCVIGLVTGVIMYKLRTYKWLGFGGSLIRLVGYAVMIRFRTNTSSLAELFVVQIIQGLGSGVIETVIIVAAQIVVPQAQLAQVTSLVLLGNFLGYAIGSSIAGAIYTGTLTERLKLRLGSDWGVDSLRDSITGTLPTWGTDERKAVNQAVSFLSSRLEIRADDAMWQYSDVMGYVWYSGNENRPNSCCRYITYAAMAMCIPVIVLALLMPDERLW